ncbi:L,D-transpeptidase catalytic domain [Hydrobacter penzbergensis]|uniref:L,D-transpeptidase catalytic domain n=1 Tax=Hydrobacter penzbergensis TaxID=1235997 RepID=A0A8X8LET4_9BACT|nr:murein L,D-transpeptidase catalytic domain family protein [Hydrobacter penzbergensis]SDX37870.1 L,D-transpeptidase catalytic domain [Hydrobacter penzbergensis]
MGRSFIRSFGVFVLIISASLAFMSFVVANSSGSLLRVSAPDTVPVIQFTANEGDARLSLYEKLALDSLGLSHEAFEYALKGHDQLQSDGKIEKDNLLSIIDFSLPSGKKRLFVIDLESEELLFNTYVAHGRNSGKDIATKFSNKPNSFKSSLGFYVTGDTYTGKHGYSMRLNGEESGINDRAEGRGIVMHSAAYANENSIEERGFIGRSLGCPAIPKNVHRQIIETICHGSCLFMYSPDAYYLSHSKLI